MKRFFSFSFLLLFISLEVFTLQGYYSANDVAKKLNLEVFWEPLSEELIFKKKNLEVSCKIGQSLTLFSNNTRAFFPAPRKKDGLTLISKEMYKQFKSFFSVPKKELEYKVAAILIDPGHGGKDPGCIGSYVKNGKTHIMREKDIALKVGKNLYSMLKRNYPNKKILLTRSKDTYPTLGARVAMANAVKLGKNESVIYVSIHVNAALNNKASGFEVWYLPPEYRRQVLDKKGVPKEIHSILNSMLEEEFTAESILMAQNILNGLDAQIGKHSKSRGLKANQWFVVRNVKMPSVLVELGFITNKKEVRLMDSPAYLKKCAQGIYNGLSEFINSFESGN